MSKQTIYNAGIYVRLSQEDERAGESLSIENQKLILTKYVKEQGWNLVDTYVDDGWSGTDFDRPAVQRLLSDAQSGKINLIICKDLSRFGRNYIEVGRYVDYIFPSYNIRFIALDDNVDTTSKNTAALDMMPIINLFNEWHAASTSKKIKAVIEADAKAGKYRASCAPFGYIKGDDPKKLPVIDLEAAAIVRRIFEMRSQGISPYHICNKLNEEHILIPSDYYYKRIGKPNPRRTKHLWNAEMLRQMLKNPTYLGNLVQLRTTTVSYKNHKTIKRDPEDMVVIENTHEPIISQELWDKVREVENSVSQGKKTKSGFVAPLSGLMFCVDCGEKMRLGWNNTTNGSKKKPRKYIRHNFNCNSYNKYGKKICPSHYIKMNDMNAIVLADIRSMASLVIKDEKAAKGAFLAKKEQLTTEQTAGDRKKLNDGKYRLAELEKLIQSVYEDKVLGNIPESVCINLLTKYETEQKKLTETVSEISERLSVITKNENDVALFIDRLKKYVDVQELTREMCLELIEYITVDAYTADKPREIHIYYKLLDKPLNDKRCLYPK
jgi:DNA invertase Pin-like site-specific DNA recombinase